MAPAMNINVLMFELVYAYVYAYAYAYAYTYAYTNSNIKTLMFIAGAMVVSGGVRYDIASPYCGSEHK